MIFRKGKLEHWDSVAGLIHNIGNPSGYILRGIGSIKRRGLPRPLLANLDVRLAASVFFRAVHAPEDCLAACRHALSSVRLGGSLRRGGCPLTHLRHRNPVSASSSAIMMNGPRKSTRTSYRHRMEVA